MKYKICVAMMSLALLASCTKTVEPQYLPVAPKSAFAGEPHQAKFADFSKLSSEFRIVRMQSPYEYAKGTLVVDPTARFIYLQEGNGMALRYPIAVGKEGFEWAGDAIIGRRATWPQWRPTLSMKEANPALKDVVEGGSDNPLGARALYLYDNGVDTLYRIHGTTNPASIGTASSSGCIRMFNEHVIDLYGRVPNGTPVVVLPLVIEGADGVQKAPETPEEYLNWMRDNVGKRVVSDFSGLAGALAGDAAGQTATTPDATTAQ